MILSWPGDAVCPERGRGLRQFFQFRASGHLAPKSRGPILGRAGVPSGARAPMFMLPTFGTKIPQTSTFQSLFNLVAPYIQIHINAYKPMYVFDYLMCLWGWVYMSPTHHSVSKEPQLSQTSWFGIQALISVLWPCTCAGHDLSNWLF